MRWLLLLVATVASAAAAPVKEDPQALAQRLVDTEQECENLRKIAADKAEYAELVDACDASLLLDSYAYIDQNNVDLETEQDRFPVTTSKGEETVKKPPQLSTDELQDKLQKYEENQALIGKSSSKRAQEIVNQQVLCELQESAGDEECVTKLNCLKDEFMADQNLNLKDNLQTFPITYKGKEAKIASPPDVDRTETCKSYSTATNSAQDEVEKTEVNDADSEFAALDNLAEESANLKADGNKMVTKSLGDNPLMGLALSALANSDGGGGNNDLTNKMLGMAAPRLSGMLTENLVNKYAKGTPLARMRPQDVNTLMKLASNGFKSKENRDKLSKADVKGAIEIVTKTVVHFAILALQAKNAENEGHPKQTGLAKFVKTLEGAMVEAFIASCVDFMVESFLPYDDDLPPSNASLSPAASLSPNTPSAKGSFLGNVLSSVASGMTSSPQNPPPNAKAAPANNDANGLLKGLAASLLKTALSSQN